MKMMRRTSTTSTSGVTFMSGRTSARPRLGDTLTALLLLPGFSPTLERVRELARGRGQHAFFGPNVVREIVEGEHGRNGDCQAERRLDQRFTDAGGNRRQPARPRGRDTLERGDDSDHGSEEANERR